MKSEQMMEQRYDAAKAAIPALDRLCNILRGRSGGPYTVRAILISLWNGQPASVQGVLNLDWEIRKDVCAVMLGFGYEDAHIKIFYNALEVAVTAAGQWDWFQEGIRENRRARTK